MPPIPAERARAVLSRWTSAPVLLGDGVEGVVYALDDARVAKIWFAASAQQVRATRPFFAALSARRLPFQVPAVEEVVEVDGLVVTIERRLTGGPLSPERAPSVLVDVLAGLAAGGPLPEARGLPLLGSGERLAGDDFPTALAALAARRVSRCHEVLVAAVDDLDRLAAALPARLRQVDSGARAVVHGDLIPANVLTDDEGRAAAVLDWGFLTIEGDPVFDAAVTAAICDMYGPDALMAERRLQDLLTERLGYDRTAMLVYRAAYSLITANAYDPAGRDGHFAWCARALNRGDVTTALMG